MSSDSELHTLLNTANHHEAAVIHDVAIRAGLQWWCPCDWFNPGHETHCDGCGTSREIVQG